MWPPLRFDPCTTLARIYMSLFPPQKLNGNWQQDTTTPFIRARSNTLVQQGTTNPGPTVKHPGTVAASSALHWTPEPSMPPDLYASDAWEKLVKICCTSILSLLAATLLAFRTHFGHQEDEISEQRLRIYMTPLKHNTKPFPPVQYLVHRRLPNVVIQSW